MDAQGGGDADGEAGRMVGWTLLLRPPPLESRFWSSEVYKAWCLKIDMWTIGITLVQNGLFCLFQAVLPSWSNLRMFCTSPALLWCLSSVAQFCLAVAVAQLLSHLYFKQQYAKKWRRVALVCQRGGRFIFFLVVVLMCRDPLSHQRLHQHALQAGPQSPPTVVSTLRSISMASLAPLALLHSYSVPLPFVPQLLLASLYLCVLVVFQVPAALGMMGSRNDQIYSEACTLLSTLAMSYEAATTGLAAGLPLHWKLCQSAKGKAALVLFVMVYVGTFVPVYMSYRLERHAKELFLSSPEAQRGHHAAAPVPDPDQQRRSNIDGRLGRGIDGRTDGSTGRAAQGSSAAGGGTGRFTGSGMGRGTNFGTDIDTGSGTGSNTWRDQLHQPLGNGDDASRESPNEDIKVPMPHLQGFDALVLCVAGALSWIVIVMLLDPLVELGMPLLPLE